MTLINFDKLVEFTKDYAKNLQSNTTLIADYEQTIFEHQLSELKRIRDFEEDARDDYYSSLEETNDDD